MSKTETEARMIFERMAKLPEEARERIGYIVQGALLVADNHVVEGSQSPRKSPEKTA